jgi:hypothetical protein
MLLTSHPLVSVKTRKSQTDSRLPSRTPEGAEWTVSAAYWRVNVSNSTDCEFADRVPPPARKTCPW